MNKELAKLRKDTAKLWYKIFSVKYDIEVAKSEGDQQKLAKLQDCLIVLYLAELTLRTEIDQIQKTPAPIRFIRNIFGK